MVKEIIDMKMKVWRVLALVISAIAAITVCVTVVTYIYAFIAYPNSWATTNPRYIQLAVANPELYKLLVYNLITAIVSSFIAYKLVKGYNKTVAAKRKGRGVN